MGKEAELDASADFVIEDPDFDEDDIKEAEELTKAKLIEGGFLKDEEAETPDKEAEALESESEAAPTEEHPQEEQIAEEAEEHPLILGKYKTQEDLERGHQELQSDYTRKTQELAQLAEYQNVVNKLLQDEETRNMVLDTMMGKPLKKTPEIQIPQGTEFYEWLGSDPKNLDLYYDQRSQPLMRELSELKQTQNALLGFVEEMVTEQKYGAEMKEMKPYIDQVKDRLGERARYTPMEDLILMASGLKAKADASNGETQKANEEEQKRIQEEHRAKVLAAKVETADETTSTGRVVDLTRMSSADIKKYLTQAGVEYRRRD